jgi:hypothetical protein
MMMQYTGLSQADQVNLLTELAEILDEQTLDRVAAMMTEMDVLDADIAALAMAISGGAEVEECEFCGEYGVIAGENEEAGLKYCQGCKADGLVD